MAAKIDLVTFAPDGGLIDSDGISAGILIEVLRDLNLPVDFDCFYST